MLFICCGIQPLCAFEKSHHNLSWIGYLRLPKEDVKIPKTIELTEPRLWEEWRHIVDPPITWFPKVTEANSLAPDALIIRFDPPSNQPKVRRVKRKL